ncbi:MAG: helix-turn-helix transcriptional regulator [Chloroflexi bacterium]|nr:helix-turn-helix transcriptional regulator [Chloroflexota bacterium]
MSLLSARVKNAERMMTHGAANNKGIEITFADGCSGRIPFADIPEIGNASNLKSIELPNPYQINIRTSQGEIVELPWDFARHYCDSSYRTRVEAVASEGTRALGKRIRAVRESMGMTQLELAKAAGIGRVTEVRIENGEQSPRYKTLVAIAQTLRRPVTDLITSG